MTTFKPPGQCPACGEWVPRKAAACDCCGACERSGWKPDGDVYDGLDLPDEDFNYDDFIAREFGDPRRAGGLMSNKWWWVALILVVVMALGYFLPVLIGRSSSVPCG
jgi:hypothetical protein